MRQLLLGLGAAQFFQPPGAPLRGAPAHVLTPRGTAAYEVEWIAVAPQQSPTLPPRGADLSGAALWALCAAVPVAALAYYYTSPRASRTPAPGMYGAARTATRSNRFFAPAFGDNTYERREELSAARGVVVPTSQEQSDWYYEEEPQLVDQFEPYFGDNTYSRRAELSSHEGVVAPTSQAYIDWYVEEKPRAFDQFEPFFGDNTYPRRAQLSKTRIGEPTMRLSTPRSFAKRTMPAQMYGVERNNKRYDPDFGDNTFTRREELSSSKGVVVPTSKEQSDWYHEVNPQANDQFEPFFGDNTYGRRAQLSKTRTREPTMAMPLSHDLVYGERKLAWGSTAISAPGAPSVSDLKGQQPARKAGKTVSSTGVACKQGEPFEQDFVYGEPTLAWDAGNRTKMVKTVTESSEDMSTGVVKPSPEMVPRTSAKRTVPAQMYGGERTNERYNPDFGDNTFARREELSSSKGVVVPTSPAYSDEEKPKASDQYEPFFGDNMYERRAELSKK